MSASTLPSVFYFAIRQCSSDKKIEKNSVNALSTVKLSSNSRSKMFHIFFLKKCPFTLNAFK